MTLTGEEQYLDLAQRIIENGKDIYNERTGKFCRTVINADFEYDTSQDKLPLITTRKSYYRQAIAEMIGYLRGYRNADDFAKIGCNTWFKNANENKDWLANKYRQGENDLGSGFSYANGRIWFGYDVQIDQFENIVYKLSRGIDDRRLIMSFYNPGTDQFSCLPACMWNHTFSLVDGVLDLTSTQRSVDVPLGLNFNMVQCVFLLRLVAKITGLESGTVYHKMINCHIYEDQIDLMKEQLKRKPFPEPTLYLSPSLFSLKRVEELPDIIDHITVKDYQHHDAIEYPFST